MEGDIEAVLEVLRGAWLTQGPKVAEFEGAIAEYCGARHGVAFANGTAALHAACAVSGIGPGDEAVTTPLTFAATANAVVYCGGTPRFADVRPDTLNIDPEAVAEAITERTRAILPVDFAGHPADPDRLFDLARRNGLTVIEDASHALGARWKGRCVGGLADMTIFSFHPVKHITSGEGGVVLTDDAERAERLRRFRHHGIDRPSADTPWCYEISDLGFNYRLTDIQCALGLSQLNRADALLERREGLAHGYREALASSPFVTLPAVLDGVRHAWHIFVVLLDLERIRVDRDEVMRALRAENIGVQLHYPLVHLHPYYRRAFDYGEGLCPVAESLFPRLMTLPLFPSMTDSDQEDVLEALDKVLSHFALSDVPAG